MAIAARTKDVVLIHEGDTVVKVRRPMADHPRTRYSTFTQHQRAHYIVQNDLTQKVRVHFRLFEDKGMLEDLVRRAARNRDGRAVRGPAVASDGQARVDYSGKFNLIAAAANTKGGKASDGPLTVKVKLLEQPVPFMPLCRHCQRPPAEHEHVVDGYKDAVYGGASAAWWCVPGPKHCQVCAAAPGKACEYKCPNRDARGGSY